MGNVSRPLIGLLVATVALFAVWTVALKPTSSGSSSSSGSTYQSAIAKAHQAVAISAAANAARGGVVASGWAGSHSTPATNPAPIARAVHVAPATRHRLDAVSRALNEHEVLALLFYNPAAADDQAVKQELAAVPAHGRSLLKLAVPLSELTRYVVVTSQVPVNISPTLVLIDRHRQATTIIGFADRFEIEQRLRDALG